MSEQTESAEVEAVAAPEEADERDGSFLIGWKQVTRQDYLAFTRAIGFGDDVTEPAARPDEMLDAIEQAFSEASEHIECPVICEPCGERLADKPCPHCNGSGCGPGTARGAYEECEWCAGVGKIHEGCVEKSYGDLVSEVAAAEARGAQAVLAAVEASCLCLCGCGKYRRDRAALRAARAAAAAAGGVEGGAFDKALAETRAEYREALERLGDS